MILLKFVYTIYAWSVLFLIFFLHYFSSHIWVFISQDPLASYRLNKPLIRFGFFLMGVRLTGAGLDTLPKDRPFILASNHESNLDILSLIAFTPVPVKFVAKKELLKTPFLGHCIRSQGHIVINRSHARDAIKEMEKIGDIIYQGNTAMIFPEGTRTSDGAIQPFKRGIGKIAYPHNLTIIPCRIKGAYHLMGKGSWFMTPGTIHITYGDPILPSNFENEKVLVSHLESTIRSL